MPTPSPFLTAGLAAVERGDAVVPLGRRGGQNKRPLLRWAYAATTPEEIEAYARAYPRADGAGIILRADQVVIDCDTPQAVLWAEHNLPRTYKVTTGRPEGGAHYHFTWSGERLRTNPAMKNLLRAADVSAPAFEFKTQGSYVVAPGSLHASGAVYTAADLCAPPTDLPAWLAELVGPWRPAEIGGEDELSKAEIEEFASRAQPANPAWVSIVYLVGAAELRRQRERLSIYCATTDDRWADAFFEAAIKCGTWVAHGLPYADCVALLEAAFKDADEWGGDPSHVSRSIRRGLAHGARAEG